MTSNIKPVILCGGAGTRLWPLSRDSYPKQYVSLIDGRSLLDLTISRVKNFGMPLFVANEAHRFYVQELLNKEFGNIGLRGASILLEPDGRNTAPAMAAAALMPNVSPSDLLLFLPADHFIRNANDFISIIQAGVAAADAGFIVTFGVKPSFPNVAYGYIQMGSELSSMNAQDQLAYSVARFIEKPTLDKAQQMLISGGFLWNAGIFLCKAKVLIEALSKYAPDILRSCQSSMEDCVVDGDFIRPQKDSFLSCRSESIDYAVMERFEKIAVVPFGSDWTDLGSWNAVAELSSSDESGNRVNGQGIVSNAQNTYIYAPHRPVVALGTDNLVIVDTPDAVLVASADKVEQVKDVVVELKKNKISQAIVHRRVSRPWGWYDSLDVGDRFQVKRILVKPGASLSLQMHHYRAEHWIVVKGTAKVTNGEKVFFLEENQSTYIPIGVMHRLQNLGDTDLEMIEVQSGIYLGEDDIVRFDDTYGRR